jgi:hypothetical protein
MATEPRPETPTPTVTETPTPTGTPIETTTTTLPEVTKVPEQRYIEFNSYEITLPSKVRLDKVIRIYSGGRFGSIGGVGSNYFPFVSTIVVRTGRERINYYRLLNTNGQVVFTTDEEGLSSLFNNNSSELSQA